MPNRRSAWYHAWQYLAIVLGIATVLGTVVIIHVAFAGLELAIAAALGVASVGLWLVLLLALERETRWLTPEFASVLMLGVLVALVASAGLALVHGLGGLSVGIIIGAVFVARLTAQQFSRRAQRCGTRERPGRHDA